MLPKASVADSGSVKINRQVSADASCRLAEEQRHRYHCCAGAIDCRKGRCRPLFGNRSYYQARFGTSPTDTRAELYRSRVRFGVSTSKQASRLVLSDYHITCHLQYLLSSLLQHRLLEGFQTRLRPQVPTKLYSCPRAFVNLQKFPDSSQPPYVHTPTIRFDA